MSGLFKLKLPDWANGALMAGGGALTGYLLQLLQSGGSVLHPKWDTIANVSVGGALTYIAKKFFTNSQGVALGIQATATPLPDLLAVAATGAQKAAGKAATVADANPGDAALAFAAKKAQNTADAAQTASESR